MYYFGMDKGEQEYLLSHVQSGGVCINTYLHYVQEDLPFGGFGASGMGAYHGPEGFRNMSRNYSQTLIDCCPSSVRGHPLAKSSASNQQGAGLDLIRRLKQGADKQPFASRFGKPARKIQRARHRTSNRLATDTPVLAWVSVHHILVQPPPGQQEAQRTCDIQHAMMTIADCKLCE